MSFSPLVWKSFDLSNPKQEQLFMGQLTDLLNFLNSARGLSTLLNGSATLQNTSGTYVATEFSFTSASASVSCAGASGVAIYAALTTALSPTLTLLNLAPGVPVMICFNNASGSTATFKLSATNPSGIAYSPIWWKSAGGINNMVSAGLGIGNGNAVIASGASSGNGLLMVVN